MWLLFVCLQLVLHLWAVIMRNLFLSSAFIVACLPFEIHLRVYLHRRNNNKNSNNDDDDDDDVINLQFL